MWRSLIAATVFTPLVVPDENAACALPEAVRVDLQVGAAGVLAITVIRPAQTREYAVVEMKTQFFQCRFDFCERHVAQIVADEDPVGAGDRDLRYQR